MTIIRALASAFLAAATAVEVYAVLTGRPFAALLAAIAMAAAVVTIGLARRD